MAAPSVRVLTASPGLSGLGLEPADHIAQWDRDEQVAQPGDKDGGHADVLVQGVTAELGQLPVLQGEAEQINQRGVLSADVWKFVGGQELAGGRCSCQAPGSVR